MHPLKSTEARAHWIHTKLSEALTPTHLEVIDQGWQHVGHAEEGAGHFLVRIASPHFKNKKIIDCHRLIYQTLGNTIGQGIHALQIDIQA